MPVTADMVFPIAEYPHTEGTVVTGGYVYRGNEIPDLQGVYVYGDFGFQTMWMAYRDRQGQWHNDLLMDSERTISSFGEDEQNELYLVDYSGAVLRFVPAD
jgi:hypothetical protein